MTSSQPFLWLILGVLLTGAYVGTGILPAALWLAPICMLHFLKVRPAPSSLFWMWAGLYLAAAAANRGVIPLPGAAYFVIIFAVSTCALIPYVAHRFLTRDASGFASTLILPATWVAIEFLPSVMESKGTWGVAAYTQRGNLPLMQLASVTGIYGISFLATWFASVVSWMWDRDFSRDAMRGGLTYAGVFSFVILGGVARIAFAPSATASVRVAAVSYPAEFCQIPDVERMLGGRLPDAERERMRARLNQTHDWFFDNTRREARAGAKFVLWPEMNLVTRQEDEAAFLQRAGQLARDEHIYLLMGMGVIRTGTKPPLVNKTVLLDPNGHIALTHEKARAVAGWEASVMARGDGIISVAETPVGRVAAAICYEADFPSLIRQAGRAKSDVLFIVANDWRAIKDVHFRMAGFRAVENGVTLIRATSSGISGVVDPFGRVLSMTDHFTPGARIMVAQVPIVRVPAIYATAGDLFAWLCIAGVIAASILNGMRAVRSSSYLKSFPLVVTHAHGDGVDS